MMIKVEGGIVPDGYVPLKFGAPRAFDTYMTPDGEVRTAYYDIHGSCYLILIIGVDTQVYNCAFVHASVPNAIKMRVE